MEQLCEQARQHRQEKYAAYIAKKRELETLGSQQVDADARAVLAHEVERLRLAFLAADIAHREAERSQADLEWERGMTLESAPADLQMLANMDMALYTRIRAEVLMLRTLLDSWNEHVDRKIELRDQIQRETGETVDAGYLAKVDPAFLKKLAP